MPKWLLNKIQMKDLIKPKDIDPRRLIYEKAYWQWYRDFSEKEFDREINSFASLGVPKKNDWIRSARQAQFMSLECAAKRLKVSHSAFSQLEKSEASQKIKIEKLAEVAKALNCELVYFFRPNGDIRFSEHLWHFLFCKLKGERYVQREPFEKKAKALATFTKRMLKNAKFRKKMGLSLRVDEKPSKSQFFFYGGS